MQFTKLEIQGFKSFADKTILEFSHKVSGDKKGITAVVGPNGSGKSNIADAVRWVLGEQSLKILRGKLSEDVVFAGSEMKNRLNFAEVTATFDNTDQSAPLEYPEIVIRRRIFRSGESEYHINNSKVRLQDIVLFLAKAHVGQKSYSVIGQGMIDQIFALTPEARKNFFDEATGVKEYQIKRDQSILKINHTRENLKEVEIQLAEIEPRLRSLTRQKKRLEERAEVEKTLRELQRIHFTNIYNELKNSIDSLNGKKRVKENEINAGRTEAEKLSLGLDEFEKASARGTAYGELNEQYQRLFRERANTLGGLEIIRAKKTLGASETGGINLISLEEQKHKINQSLSSLENEINHNKKSFKEADENLENLKIRLSGIKKIKQTHQAELHSSGQNSERRLIADWDKIYKRIADFLHGLETANTLETFEDLREEVHILRNDLIRFHQNWRGRPASQISSDPAKLVQIFEQESALLKQIADIEAAIRFAKESEDRLKRQTAALTMELEYIEKTVRAARDNDKGRQDSLFAKEEEDLLAKQEKLDRDIKRLETQLSEFQHKETEERRRLIELEKTFREAQNKLRALEQNLSAINIDLTREQTRLEELERTMNEELPDELMQKIKTEKLTEQDSAQAQNPEFLPILSKAKHQLELIGGIDETVVAEHTSTAERFDFLTGQTADLQKSLADLENLISDLDETIHKEFSKNFRVINEHFEHYFKILFRGGKAKLILEERLEKPTNELDEAEDEPASAKASAGKEKTIEDRIAGIEIRANPPGKKISSVNMLSGGERSLTAIALICAIISANPSPFVVLDEVDAALDEANTHRFAGIIEELSHKTQFIVITHNRATMEKSQMLYGVTMGQDGISKILSIKLEEAAGMAKTQA